MKCIVCEKKIELNDCDFNNATAFEITCGYGSRFDGDIYEAIICDECLKPKAIKGIAEFKSNYIFPTTPEQHKEQMKKLKKEVKVK